MPVDTEAEIESMHEPLTYDEGTQVSFGPFEPDSLTLGAAKDRIIFLTQQLARKDKQLLECQSECKLFEQAFNEAKL